MKQIGIEFDEGYYIDSDNSIKEKGEFGPYLQSKRLDKYQAAANQLIEEKKAYYCFCSQERLDTLRKEQMALKKPAMYDRHCRNLTEDEIPEEVLMLAREREQARKEKNFKRSDELRSEINALGFEIKDSGLRKSLLL
jgi:glutamyl/glutaminyl-tRNA synthetase